MQLPCSPGKQGELSENLGNDLMADSVASYVILLFPQEMACSMCVWWGDDVSISPLFFARSFFSGLAITVSSAHHHKRDTAYPDLGQEVICRRLDSAWEWEC